MEGEWRKGETEEENREGGETGGMRKEGRDEGSNTCYRKMKILRQVKDRKRGSEAIKEERREEIKGEELCEGGE